VEGVEEDAQAGMADGVEDLRRGGEVVQEVAGDRRGADRLDQHHGIGGGEGVAEVVLERGAGFRRVGQPGEDMDRAGADPGGECRGRVDLAPGPVAGERRAAEGHAHAGVEREDREAAARQRLGQGRRNGVLRLVVEFERVEPCGGGPVDAFQERQVAPEKAGVGGEAIGLGHASSGRSVTSEHAARRAPGQGGGIAASRRGRRSA
jgi:hypothetical protein